MLVTSVKSIRIKTLIMNAAADALTTMNTQILEYVRQNHDRYLSELKEYLSMPSISTLPENKRDVERTADWIRSQLQNIGMERIGIVQTDGHPVVRGDWLKAPSGRPTVMIYGHYDVQPVDPLDQWVSPPFTPTVRGDNIYARGAADMKGQGHALLKALEALMKKTGSLPVNTKILFEGEEELGSPHLDSFIEKNKEELRCDFCLNCDADIAKPDLPSLAYGLRGLEYYEVWIRGPKSDLHSGSFGGIVHNPAVVLSELIAGLHDRDGRVTLRGFYDKVRKLSKEESQEIKETSFSDEEWRKAAGVERFYGEKGFSLSERVGARPTLEVNGMVSGFTGQGQKTVLPASAMAKISMRTVPYQVPEQIDASLRQYFREKTPSTVQWEIKRLSSSPYAIIERGTRELSSAAQALTESYGAKPVFKLEGGTVPVVSMLKSRLGVNSIMLGCGLPDAGIHGPNEKLHLPTYYKGIETYVRFLDLLAQ